MDFCESKVKQSAGFFHLLFAPALLWCPTGSEVLSGARWDLRDPSDLFVQFLTPDTTHRAVQLRPSPGEVSAAVNEALPVTAAHVVDATERRERLFRG